MSDASTAAAPSSLHSQQITAAEACSSPSDPRKKQKRASSSVLVGPSDPVPAPIARWSALYDDALHSIFKFAGLSRLMSVSRRWSQVVLTVPSIGAPVLLVADPRNVDVESANLRCVLASRLRRHVCSVRRHGSPGLFSCSLSAEQVHLVSAGAPWLSAVDVQLFFDSGADSLSDALMQLKQFRHLEIRLPKLPTRAINNLIRTNGGLHKLHTLVLHFASLREQISLDRCWL